MTGEEGRRRGLSLGSLLLESGGGGQAAPGPTLELLKMTWVAKFRYTRLKLDSVTVAKLWWRCEQ